jgi:RNA-directed DNA polymerase
MTSDTASEKQQSLRLTQPGRGGEITSGLIEDDTPVPTIPLMERVVDRYNLQCALQQVQRNKGSAGIDGMTVDDLPTFLKKHWPSIKTQLLNGSYQPQPVRQVLIPKPDGGTRALGIPTVVDRFIQQALLQVIQAEWDRTFSHFSFGFRPKRSAHHAVAWSQHYVNHGYKWVVDMDLEKFFDRVNHDKLMHRVKQRVDDKRVLILINRYLKAGVMINGYCESSLEGTPQGGPLSPLLGNLLLDDLDKELEKRGLHFVRYADDCNVYVKSKRAGERVLASITHWLSRYLKLTVNAQKSAVDRPWHRSFLGFTVSRRGKLKRRKVSDKSLKRFKLRIRVITRRTRGRTLNHIVTELRRYLLGWRAYFGYAEVKSPLRDLDKWVRRRLRSYIWKQWGRAQYRELRKRGIDRFLAWNTAKSAHGPWRLSASPALYKAFPNRYFVGLGVTSLVEC